MNETQFINTMRQGLGRCYTELAQSGDREQYRGALSWACTHGIAYDAQCEGTKAAYLYRMLALFPDREYFLSIIAESYRPDLTDDFFLFNRQSELLFFFAADGYAEAERALREMYDRLYASLLTGQSDRRHDARGECFEYLAGLFLRRIDKTFPEKLVSDFGSLFLREEGQGGMLYEGFFHSLESSLGKTRMIRELERRKAQPWAKAFLGAYLKTERLLADMKVSGAPDVPTADELFDTVRAGGELTVAQKVRFARKAAANEKDKLAWMLERLKDPARQASLLSVFRRTNYPGSRSCLIGFCSSDCAALANAADEVLAYTDGSEVRSYARKRLLCRPDDGAALLALIRNFRDPDKDLLLCALDKVKFDPDETDWHGVVMQIIATYGYGVKLPVECLRFVYEKSYCSVCREKAVRLLGRRNLLSEELLNECAFDARESIVAYVTPKLKR